MYPNIKIVYKADNSDHRNMETGMKIWRREKSHMASKAVQYEGLDLSVQVELIYIQWHIGFDHL